VSWFTIAQAAPAPQGLPFTFLLMIGGMMAVLYFIQIRPMQKREKEKQDMQASLAKGVEVITAGGICGSIVGLTDTHAVLRVDDNTKIQFLRSSIVRVVSNDSKGE